MYGVAILFPGHPDIECYRTLKFVYVYVHVYNALIDYSKAAYNITGHSTKYTQWGYNLLIGVWSHPTTQGKLRNERTWLNPIFLCWQLR